MPRKFLLGCWKERVLCTLYRLHLDCTVSNGLTQSNNFDRSTSTTSGLKACARARMLLADNILHEYSSFLAKRNNACFRQMWKLKAKSQRSFRDDPS